jgi:DNA-binding LacI/PurR family transcriptional regulator
LGHTIYDIARVANVSKSTVSRVLNNQSNISNDARERVLNAIEQLNYQPSKLARGLSSGFDAILVVSRSTKTTAHNPFFSEIMHTISAKAEEENFDVIIQTSNNSDDELKKCISKIKEKMIKGILMLSSPTNEDFYKHLDAYNIPIVVIGKVVGQYKNVFSIDTNNYEDSYNLTQYLIEQGHTEIACIHSSLEYHVSKDRLEGYISCLKDHNLPVRREWIFDGGYTVESAYEAVKQFYQLSHRPSGVFATDDLKVMSLYKIAHEEGITIPDDLSIVGYSNNYFSPFLSPSPTSIEIPVTELGNAGTQLLFSKIKSDPEVKIGTIIPTKISIHGSVTKNGK